jgi:DNA-binding LytR/AlgR family response regulator
MIELLTCVIVDDEPVARGIIRNYCGHLPFIRILGEFGNALDAREFLSANKTDLLFLDIHMPVLSGVSFLKTLKDPPQVIFTTAYQEYAVNAFDLAACDYLLKPFSLERFIVAIDKAKERLLSPVKLAGQSRADNITEAPGSIFIKTDGKLQQMFFNDCLYAEAQGNYTKLVTTDATILTKMAFSAFINQFPTGRFIRVHRSFVINKDRIRQIDGNRLFIGQAEIPVAPAYKSEFLKTIGVA